MLRGRGLRPADLARLAGEASKVCDGLSQSGKGWAAYVQKVGSDSSGLYRINVSKGANSHVQDVFAAVNGAQVAPGTENPTIVWPAALPADDYYGPGATRRGASCLSRRCCWRCSSPC